MKRRAFHLGLGRGHIARDVDEEIAFHIETKVQRLVAAGLSPDAARIQAMAEFGDRERVRQDCISEDQYRERATNRMSLFDEIRQDLAYTARTMRRNPLFTAIVVLTLGLGIAANTSIFTLVNAVLLRPLPVDSPGDLVAIGNTARTGGMITGSPSADLLSYPVYRDLLENQVMPDIFASGRAPFFTLRTSVDEDSPRGEYTRYVSGNYFKVLRVPAMLGRVFDGSEDRTVGTTPWVVISYNLWKRRFGASEDVIGKRIYLSNARHPMTVIGVAPQGFTGEIVGRNIDIWIPVTMQQVLEPNQKMLSDRATNWLLAIGRRPPGVSLERVTAVLEPAIIRSIMDHPVPGQAFRPDDEKVRIGSGARGFSAVRASYATPLKTMMVGVVLVLLIICVNVANLLLARALARSKEMGVRMAIGAGRDRLIRQLLTESLVLGMLGGLVGLFGAVWGSRLLLKMAADGGSTLPLDIGIDLPVLGFTAGIAIFAVLLSGFVPALRASRVDLATSMRAKAGAILSGGASARGQRMPLGRLLIGAQVALSLVLLVGAALLVKSLRQLQSADPGMARERLIVAELNGVPNGYTGERLTQLAMDVIPRLGAIPGVVAVTFSENGIFWGQESGYTVGVAGHTGSSGDSITLADYVGPDYVKSIGARLVRGRDIGRADARGATNVVLVNETFARRFFAGRNPIGGTVTVQDTVPMTVVGVVADVKDHSLTEQVRARMYMSFAQQPADPAGAARMIIRTTVDPAALIPAVRTALTNIDARMKNNSVSTVSTLMRDSVAEERLLARLATGFGLLALVLAAVGLYGVMTYAVTRRTAEIGLRVALGAQRSDVIRMVLGDAMTLVLIGMIVGVPAALAAARLLQAQLYGVTASDPASISTAVAVLAASAAIAALAPALRASRVAPLLSLREE